MALAPMRKNDLRHWWGVRGWAVAIVAALAVAVLPAAPVAAAGTASISGTVIDSWGNPSGDTYVGLHNVATGTWATTIRTAADGTYTFTDVEAGTYKLRMWGSYAYDSATAWYPGVYDLTNATPVTVTDGQVVENIDVDLAPAGHMRGTVLDGFGNPPTGAVFHAGSMVPGNDWTTGVIVQSNGSLWANVVPAGTYWIRVEGPGYVTQWYQGATSLAGATGIPVADYEDRTGLDFVLEWTGGIQGTVVDQDGAPVPDVTVTASGAPGTRSTTSAADGTYRMSLPGGTYTVEVSSTSETPPYATVWYDGAASADLATSVVVTSGAWRSGIDAQLVGDYSTISGVVTDDLGDPVAGATVDVHLGADVVGTTTTDAVGTYAVGGLVAGSYLVSFSAVGHLGEYHADADRDSATPVVLSPGGDATVDAVLTRSVSVVGTLTDARGLPVEATVALLAWGTGTEVATVSSGPDGGYAFTDLSPGDYVVQVRTGGVMVDEYYDDALDLATALPLVLAPGDAFVGADFVLDWSGGITGIVTDLMGTPLEGATVTALDGAVGTTTAADGSYTLPLPAGEHTVAFASTEGVLYLTLELPVTVDMGAFASLDAALTPATASIAGTVTNDLGEPLAGVWVIVSSTGDGSVSAVVTGADGTYLAPVEPDVYDVEFVGTLADATTEFYDNAADPGSATPVTVLAGEDVTGIDAQLDRLATISGTVLDEAGAPLPGAYVEVLDLGGAALGGATTDANGTFSVTGLPPGSYKANASADGFFTQYFDGETTFDDGYPIDVVPGEVRGDVLFALDWDSGISGVVTDVDGVPLAEVTVRATSAELVRETVTSENGTYSLDLPAGDFVVGFSYRTGEPVYVDEWFENAASADAASPVTVLLGARTTGISAALVVDDPTISGTVTDADGVPLENVSVVAYDSTLDVSRSASTASDGTYTIDGLAPGSYEIRFATWSVSYSHVGEFYPGAYLAEDATLITVATGDEVTGIDAALQRAASISGAVHDPNGAALDDVDVTVTDLAGVDGLLHGRLYVHPDGWFTVSGIPAGTYRLGFDAPGYVAEYYDDAATLDAATPVTLAAGDIVAGVDVTLAWASGISGTVVDEAGAPMAGVHVWAEGYAGWDSTVSGPSGEYALSLPAGEYLVGFVSESMNPVYLELFYDGATEYDLAEPVTVVADAYTTGIDAQMVVDYVVPTFTDVAPGQVFGDDIAWLAENGIAGGWSDGTFRPVAPVTREAMAVFLHRLVERLFAVVPVRAGFVDVTPGNPFFDDILWTADNGIATGWPDGTFRPSLAIERQAMAAFLYRFAGSPDFEAPAVSPFADVQPGDAFYTEICWLADQGIATGTVTPSGTFFKPAEPVERQAMAAFLHRMWEGGRK